MLPSFDDEVAVCGDESFIQVTVSPTLISIGFRLYEFLPESPTMLTIIPSSIAGGGDDDDISSCEFCTESPPPPPAPNMDSQYQ